MKPMRVLRVPSLAAFVLEIPPPVNGKAAVVRLNVTESFLPNGKTAIPRKQIGLSLQAVNADGELAWLHEGHVIVWMPDGPGFADDRSIYAGMPVLRDIVRAHLQSLGYDVRDGDYALPASVQPLNARFECACWVKTGEHTWQPMPEGGKQQAREEGSKQAA
jgi:hypothetical protein